jgi:DNA-binding LacI/PurR family transcriptional regulator
MASAVAAVIHPFRSDLSLIERCRRVGLAVPEELSVIGTDNFDYTATELADISSIEEHHDQIGRLAAQLLLRMINRESVACKTWKVPVEVVLRNTTAPPLSLTENTRNDQKP